MSTQTMGPVNDMGIWTEDGDICWMPKEYKPKRSQAMMWFADLTECNFIEVRCLSRWMRYEPRETLPTEDYWIECEKTDPGAFPVWRLK